jgi:hypothetical protein
VGMLDLTPSVADVSSSLNTEFRRAATIGVPCDVTDQPALSRTSFPCIFGRRCCSEGAAPSRRVQRCASLAKSSRGFGVRCRHRRV